MTRLSDAFLSARVDWPSHVYSVYDSTTIVSFLHTYTNTCAYGQKVPDTMHLHIVTFETRKSTLIVAAVGLDARVMCPDENDRRHRTCRRQSTQGPEHNNIHADPIYRGCPHELYTVL